MRRALLFVAAWWMCAALTAGPAYAAVAQGEASSRSGSEIYQRFQDHLAEPECPDDASTRWRKHFAHAGAWRTRS